MFARLLHGSIKKKLAILFLMAALPAILIIVIAGLDNHRRAVSDAERQLQTFSRHMAETQTQITLATKALLEGLAMLPEVRQGDVEACNRLFANLLKINPDYAALHLVNPHGNLVASGSARKPANFAHTRHFREAVATKAFATGEYLLGVTLHVPVFTFGYPVLNDRNEIAGVLLTSIRLDSYGELFRHTPFPDSSFVGVCDRNGLRLFRYPENSAMILGDPIKQKVFEHAMSGPSEGLLQEESTDGVERIVAFQKLSLTADSPPYMYFFVGAPSTMFYADAKSGMLRDFVILFLTIGLTMLSGWFLGGRTVGMRLEELAGAAKRIGEGDLSVRVTPAPEITEVDVLAQAFNNMAESLTQDIARRTRAEKALAESEFRFRKLFEQIPSIAVQGYGMDGRTRYWNQASQNLYGYSASEAIGVKLTDLIIPPEIRGYVEADMRSMAETKIPIPASELTLMRKDGSRVLVFSSHAIVTNAGGEAELFCVDVDLTSRKEAEEALLRLKEAAEAANQAKSEFLANMSHEIRTPINGVMGMLQLLETTTLDAEQTRYVHMAAEAANRLTRLLTDILDLSRVEAGKMEVRKAAFQIRDIIDSVAGLFAVTARNKGVALECSLDPTMPATLIGDEMRVRQVLFNLVGNALKFTDRGTVGMEITTLPPRTDDDIRVRFQVTDTGIGIPEDRLSAIFEPFRQVENSYTRNYQGAGLGLSIVHRLVGLMDGEISIESTPGTGTTVHVVLPFKMDRENSAQIVEPAAIKTGAGFRVLLVEDDPSNRIPTQKLLEKAGHEVTLAENGRQALELLAENDFDCILMDIQMPVMSGVEATRIIRGSDTLGPKKDIPIIALTAYAMDKERDAFLAAGMNAYVAKPATLEDMTRAMRDALGVGTSDDKAFVQDPRTTFDLP
ncbi:PAS domain S-box-containing protein [Desulfomicrobium apsheronum]|uniref:Sensory/regulatory protein RpfC n=1 Tax=Desulfomicrobium apsheronum TaxID=52560 RepID=A0A1I3V6V4_9BACT|nr:ATP-binding protein [Desulfomicrobium apsheronum]SFJ91025.1 PAS domain S-box-containing protein [Desulfomicrobium apsheronum]